MSDIRLSKNFWLSEFTRSGMASRMGREIVVVPYSSQYRALKQLAYYILQPLRDALGPAHVTSGIRPEWLNRAIGGSRNSQHITGDAADFWVSGHTPYEVAAWLEASGLPFDQLIHEFGRWVHVSIAPEGRIPRGQVLTAYKVRRVWPLKPKTVYISGLHKIKDLVRIA